MLVNHGRYEHQAHCDRCKRASPPIEGTEEEASRRLQELGWMWTNEEWRCPVCCARASGDYSRFGR